MAVEECEQQRAVRGKWPCIISSYCMYEKAGVDTGGNDLWAAIKPDREGACSTLLHAFDASPANFRSNNYLMEWKNCGLCFEPKSASLLQVWRLTRSNSIRALPQCNSWVHLSNTAVTVPSLPSSLCSGYLSEVRQIILQTREKTLLEFKPVYFTYLMLLASEVWWVWEQILRCPQRKHCCKYIRKQPG